MGGCGHAYLMLDNQKGGAVLSARHNIRGMTLVEVMIAVVIVAILFAAAAPDFSSWIQNTRIRTAAEAMQNGLYLAKNEAVHRNTTTQFVSCGGSSWDVIVASSAASTNVCDSGTASAGWARVQNRSGQNGSGNALVDTAQSTIAFNGLGRQVGTTDLVNATATPNPPVTVSVNVGATLAGASCYCPSGDCGYPSAISYASTGKLRCLRISVSSGGLVRMCDPALPGNTPQGC